ncbi:MAG TPA: HPF/RaiA family ribosome-associated protein [Candidatus Polarisedimenticolia bacterium]|nr:HPF/RaiA family ribosome-associated protein [Candidatus Polarisedimenticolia bacterium]
MLMEITYRDVPKTDELEDLIRTKAGKLERLCADIVSCRIAVEKRQQHQKLGNPHRVRIEVTLPPGKDLVVAKEPGESGAHDLLPKIVREAFKVMERQVKEANSKRRGEVKTHQEPVGLVSRIFLGEGYGFLITGEGREIYFHRNSVVDGRFDDLAVGSEARFVETMGEKGPQASTVHVLNAHGLRDAAEGVDETGAPTGRVIRTRGRSSSTRR